MKENTGTEVFLMLDISSSTSNAFANALTTLKKKSSVCLEENQETEEKCCITPTERKI